MCTCGPRSSGGGGAGFEGVHGWETTIKGWGRRSQVVAGHDQGDKRQALIAWWGYTDACSRLRLQAVVNRLRRFGLLPPEFPTHEELCEHLCGELFRQVLHNRFHVLHQLLTPVKETPYGLRLSAHNRIIPRTDNRFRRNFIIRMLYK